MFRRANPSPKGGSRPASTLALWLSQAWRSRNRSFLGLSAPFSCIVVPLRYTDVCSPCQRACVGNVPPLRWRGLAQARSRSAAWLRAVSWLKPAVGGCRHQLRRTGFALAVRLLVAAAFSLVSRSVDG